MRDRTVTAACQAAASHSRAADPDDGRRLYIDGLLALRDGDADHAASLLTAALRRQPAHPGVRRNLVRALLAAGEFRQALLQADACLANAPDDGELHFARGTALNALDEPVKACAALTCAMALLPDHAPSCLNLANAWADLDDLEAAERLCRTAVRLDPALPEAYASLGYMLTARGQTTAAIEACEASIRLRPAFTQGHWNLAIAALLSGDLRRGFAAFEWRKRHGPYQRDFVSLPGCEWDGRNPAGRTILVRAEQGLGDIIQFARFLPVIRDAGGAPILVCAPAMVPLIRRMAGVRVVSSFDPLPSFDSWIDLMSLPHVLGTTLETIPGAAGYLRADPDRAAAWRARLPQGRKVGVAFAGNPAHGNDRRRSIPLDQVVPLPALPGLTFVNLQHGPAAAGLGLPDLTAHLTDYSETAALMECLDLVVSVDTSIAHLAGALGKPVWVLLAAAPDWRWLLGREDSPWYASARLLRQERPGDWRGVLAEVMRDLVHVADEAVAGGRQEQLLITVPG
ncbi:tetratricopeptide repeat protein [Rhodopila sp.]|uniref:tetratricopeptide repeat protein n=1 Tax=Rhodopila sp. TaxID=2480087 RepID=UPI003D11E69E